MYRVYVSVYMYVEVKQKTRVVKRTTVLEKKKKQILFLMHYLLIIAHRLDVKPKLLTLCVCVCIYFYMLCTCVCFFILNTAIKPTPTDLCAEFAVKK